jgi:hypothetical protein
VTKRRLAIAAAVVFLAVGLTGCSEKAREPFHDADRGKQTNDSPADVIEMPDGFNNLATKCDNGNRIYVTFHGDSPYGSVAVVPNAEGC